MLEMLKYLNNIYGPKQLVGKTSIKKKYIKSQRYWRIVGICELLDEEEGRPELTRIKLGRKSGGKYNIVSQKYVWNNSVVLLWENNQRLCGVMKQCIKWQNTTAMCQRLLFIY